MRIEQKKGERGSLKWIQALVNNQPEILGAEILPKLRSAESLTWLSPLENDGFAEYRDADFLAKLDLGHLTDSLSQFWPQRGPQWDALAKSGDDVLLVEAKAHIAELFSCCAAIVPESRAQIEKALGETAAASGATPKAPWTDIFYQLCNRFAHLHFLRKQGVQAWLLLVNFVGDTEMGGPKTAAEWEAAYQVVYHVLGIGKGAPLLRHVLHIYPDVEILN